MVSLPFEALGPLDGVDHVAAARNQRTDDQLCHGVGVGAGGVEHHDTGAGAFLDGDVVGAGTRAGDRQQAVGQRHVVHIGAAHQDALRSGGLVVDLELVDRQLGQARRRDRVQSFDGVHKELPFPLLSL